MTNREAIDILEEVKALDDSMYAYNPAYAEALDKAIDSLRASSTASRGDTISRQAALDAITKYDFSFPQYMERFVTELRDAMKSDLINDIKALPAAQPQRMRGRWIAFIGNAVKCDQCGRFNRRSNYCPNCGADMRGGEQDE